jgi:hypothetical protein
MGSNQLGKKFGKLTKLNQGGWRIVAKISLGRLGELPTGLQCR